MSKLFNISPNQVRVVFIVHKDLEDNFLSFLFDQCAYSYVEREWDQVAQRLESIGTIIIKNDDTRLETLFSKFYETTGIVYYFVGSKHLLTTTTVDPFIHGIYVSKEQWKDFNSLYKNMYGLSFNEHIKEIK